MGYMGSSEEKVLTDDLDNVESTDKSQILAMEEDDDCNGGNGGDQLPAGKSTNGSHRGPHMMVHAAQLGNLFSKGYQSCFLQELKLIP